MLTLQFPVFSLIGVSLTSCARTTKPFNLSFMIRIFFLLLKSPFTTHLIYSYKLYLFWTQCAAVQPYWTFTTFNLEGDAQEGHESVMNRCTQCIESIHVKQRFFCNPGFCFYVVERLNSPSACCSGSPPWPEKNNTQAWVLRLEARATVHLQLNKWKIIMFLKLSSRKQTKLQIYLSVIKKRQFYLIWHFQTFHSDHLAYTLKQNVQITITLLNQVDETFKKGIKVSPEK